MALSETPGAGRRSSQWVARVILVLGCLFIVVGLSLLILFGFSSPGLPAAIWGLLLIVVYGFFEPETTRAFLGQGQLQAGTRALAQVLLIVGAVVLVNVFVHDRLSDRQWDLTKNQVNSLAPQTVQIVKGIDKPVTATIWSSQANSENQAAYDLLQRYRALNPKLTILRYTYLDHPTLATQERVTQAGTVVFQQQGHPDELTTDLTEQGLDSVLIRLTTGRSPKVYFLTGHGEPSTSAPSQTGHSITALASVLQKQGINVATLNLASGGGGGAVIPGAPALGATPSPAESGAASPAPSAPVSPEASPNASPGAVATGSVPADADGLVVLDPQANLGAGELAAINAYVDKGGHLLVAQGPFSTSNAGQLLKRFGLSIGGGIVLDQQLQARGAQGGILEIQSYGDHLVSRGLSSLPSVFFGAAPVEGSAARGYTVTPVVTTQAGSCERTDTSVTSASCQPGDKKGPFNLVVAAEQTGLKPGSRVVRAVAMGVGTLADDGILQSQNVPPGNQPLMVNAINWIAGQDKVINIPARSTATENIFLTDAQKQLVLIGYPVLLPLLLLGLGVNSYLRRR